MEGLCKGIDENLWKTWVNGAQSDLKKIVYAGGAKLINDLDTVAKLSKGKVDLTYGSSLDILVENWLILLTWWSGIKPTARRTRVRDIDFY